MKSVIFIFLLVAVLISTGCVSENQNNKEALAVQTSAVTIQQTVQIIPSPTATEKITEPIVGIWKGTFDKEGTAAYCQFLGNGEFKWSTSYGKDSANKDLVAEELRLNAERKYFGFNYGIHPDIVKINGRNFYVANTSDFRMPYRNLTWTKNNDSASEINYITKMLDGTTTTKFFYNRADDSVIIENTGLKLNRISGYHFE